MNVEILDVELFPNASWERITYEYVVLAKSPERET